MSILFFFFFNKLSLSLLSLFQNFRSFQSFRPTLNAMEKRNIVTTLSLRKILEKNQPLLIFVKFDQEINLKLIESGE